jgi:hypothetical protein
VQPLFVPLPKRATRKVNGNDVSRLFYWNKGGTKIFYRGADASKAVLKKLKFPVKIDVNFLIYITILREQSLG